MGRLTFQFFKLSLNLLKFKIPYVLPGVGGGREVSLTFQAESKSTKIQNCLCLRGEGRGWLTF